jgi:hypothetical protein
MNVGRIVFQRIFLSVTDRSSVRTHFTGSHYAAAPVRVQRDEKSTRDNESADILMDADAS